MISLTPLIHRNANDSIHAQIYDFIKQEAIAGKIKRDDRLPSIRELASYLSVSKNTVSAAYQQLIAEGYAESRSRSGIYVSYSPDACPVPVLPEEILPAPSYESAENAQHHVRQDRYNFYSGPIDTRVFPVSAWRNCLLEALHSPIKNSLDYGTPQGDYDLRKQISAYLYQSRGISCTPDQILITSGTQHAVGLLCQFLPLIRERVAIEDPGWRGVRAVFQNYQCEVDYIPLDHEGIQMCGLYDSTAKVVYVTPSHQFPMGLVMSVKRRNELLRWAIERNAFIIEDDYDSEFRYQGNPIPAMKGLDYGGRVIYLGTFSKIFLPSARMGYMVLPRPLLHDFQNKIVSYNHPVSSLIQHTTEIFMREGHFEKHVRRMRRLYQMKYAVLLSAIRRYMGNNVAVEERKAGVHLVLRADGASRKNLLAKASDSGIRVEPATDHWAGTGPSLEDHFIIGFGALNAEEIDEGIKKLADTWFS
jgi:GntR family transcriptional regulator/MocR family aminotransferase